MKTNNRNNNSKTLKVNNKKTPKKRNEIISLIDLINPNYFNNTYNKNIHYL